MAEQSTPQVAVRQIVFVEDVPAWSRIAIALGSESLVQSDDYCEFDLPGGGLLGVHRASEEKSAGSCALQIVTSAFDATREALAGQGVSPTVTEEDFGRVLDIACGPEGPDVAVVESSGTAAVRESGALMATPLSLVRDVDAAARLFTVIGLQPVLRSDAGTFVEMRAAAGEVLVHDGDGGATPSFQVDDLAALKKRCADAGLEVAIVDEAYGRTALVDGPDGAKIWVNERQRDFYGYELLSADVTSSTTRSNV